MGVDVPILKIAKNLPRTNEKLHFVKEYCIGSRVSDIFCYRQKAPYYFILKVKSLILNL